MGGCTQQQEMTSTSWQDILITLWRPQTICGKSHLSVSLFGGWGGEGK